VRKITMMMTISLDGYFEGPDRELDWHDVDEELLGHMNSWLGTQGGFLDGRITWENMAAAWPAVGQDPDAAPLMAEFAGIWLNMPKVVYSRTLEKADWNTEIVREVVAEEVMELKRRPGGDLVVGGAEVGGVFRRLGLIDEYRFYVQPVVLGRGRPLFPPGDERSDLRLAEARTFGNGVVLLRYTVD
jgi:dihydrofolate reductase